MNLAEIARIRLDHRHLSNPNFKTTAEVVQWLGAVQAQDYPAAKWSLAQRMLE